MRRTRALATLGAILSLALSLDSAISAAGEVSRPQYVAQLEQICKPRSEATSRAVGNARADVQSERFGVVRAKFTKARRIFSGTVARISAVPRPMADRATLARWFAALDRQTAYLDRSIAALRAEDIPQFQRATAEFFRQGSKSNNIVVSFEFHYCAFKPSRYE